MEIIWGITLPFPQEYPEEPQRFHNLKPCVIMSSASAYTNIFCVIKRGRAGAGGQCAALIWPWPDVSSPGFHPAALRHSPSLWMWKPPHSSAICPSIHHPACPPPLLRVTQPGAPQKELQLCVEVVLWLAKEGSLKWQLQTALVVLPSDSPKLWLCSLTCTGSSPRSDVRWPRADLQPH